MSSRRPSQCPEPMWPQWAEKCRSYLASGRWQVTSTGNIVPMLFIRKPGSDKLRMVFDLRECNKNTVKLTSPLPDMEGILSAKWPVRGSVRSWMGRMHMNRYASYRSMCHAQLWPHLMEIWLAMSCNKGTAMRQWLTKPWWITSLGNTLENGWMCT